MESFQNLTEQEGNYRHLDKMDVKDVLRIINDEDKTVASAVEKALPQVEQLVHAIADHMLAGGRLFYIGAGTSGRLGVVDASECPPTFGVPHGLVIALIAGGERAITDAVEFAEDNVHAGWNDLQKHFVNEKDVVVGLSASGTTPYVLAALEQCKNLSITTGCIVCNPGSPIAASCTFPVEVITGPEVVTGSTRMKSGTAQKMVLNMISTSVMILMGRVEDNKMVNMQLTNEKLVNRGARLVMENLGLPDLDTAKKLLLEAGSVKKAIDTGYTRN
ncbi:N-acetylmuramic acid 6-phosphate etherase [Aridibaculum aurantiacum]|uniref:N-acetylmuramic acid 6-phosphate etherase n=1 Tax=Aridibaculum aurantiacum TaxID=2810307 RepID=UPI001A96EB3D|nr:N-acetylmuramic acid 6-phosphate etherase [Aridibaculum aurantiacum]